MLPESFWATKWSETEPLDEVVLRDGRRVPKAAVSVMMMVFKTFLDKMDPKHGMSALSWGLALYDLLAIARGDDGYPEGCFGPNREKLIQFNLAQESPGGGLQVHGLVKDLAVNAILFDPATFAMSLQSPLKPGLYD